MTLEFHQLQTAIGVHSMRCTATQRCDSAAGMTVAGAGQSAGNKTGLCWSHVHIVHPMLMPLKQGSTGVSTPAT